jgi:hypothetical protein
VGLAALATSGALGLLANSKWSDAQGHCNDMNQCDPVGLQGNQDARDMGDIATITAIAGGVLVAAGVVIYLTAPKVHHEVTFTPVVGPHTTGFAIGGAF